MNRLEGQILHYKCELTSPFHSSRQEYANLLKCAPFILGSTIRGAVLSYLIETRCSAEKIQHLRGRNDPAEIAAYHRDCETDCPVKPFFANRPLAWFAFGEFAAEDYRANTRIALERSNYSVAEGAIVNIEAMAPGTAFDFEITLLDEAVTVTDVVTEAVREIGHLRGIGRLRSVGFGQFRMRDVTCRELSDDITSRVKALGEGVADSVVLEFTRPYVLSAGEEPDLLDSTRLAHRLAGEFQELMSDLAIEPASERLPLERVEASIRPDFVSRFSYERGLRAHYLVAWPRSRMSLHLVKPTDGLRDQVALASFFGLGRLNDLGFGRFKVP